MELKKLTKLYSSQVQELSTEKKLERISKLVRMKLPLPLTNIMILLLTSQRSMAKAA